MASTPNRSTDARAAVTRCFSTSSFHGDGMNLLAITRSARRDGSSASSRPMMRSLSPPPYTSAVSKSTTPASMLASHASRIVASVSDVSYPPIPQVALSPHAHVPTPIGGMATLLPGRGIRSLACGAGVSATATSPPASAWRSR
jgi:hypothetical protein